MKIVLKHVMKNIFEKKLRSVIVILTILLSTLILFIGLSLNTIINQTYTKMLQGSYGTSNIVVTKSTDDGNPFYESKNLDVDGIELEQRLDMIQAKGKTTIQDDDVNVSLYGMDADAAEEMELLESVPGDNVLTGNEVIISQRTASEHKLEIGNSIKVVQATNTYHFTVVAISKPNGIYYSEMGDILLIATREKINELYGLEDMVSSTLLKVTDEGMEEAITSLQETNEGLVVQKSSSADTMMRDEQTFQTVMLLAIIIIVLISAYVISSLSKLILTERMPVLATFRSVGAHKGMMNRVLLLEFLVYGIIGAGLGIALAMILLPFAADIFNEYKQYGVETVVEYNVIYLAISIAFGVLFPAFISILRIIRTNAKPLKEVLFNTSFTPEKHSKWTVISGIILLGIAFILYVVNQYNDLLLAVLSLLLLFVSIVILMPTLLNGLSQLLRLLSRKRISGEFQLGIKNIANNKIVANNVSMVMVVFLLLLMVGISSTGIDQYVTKTLSKDFDVAVSLTEKNLGLANDISGMDGVSKSYLQTISIGKSTMNGVARSFGVYGVEDFDKVDEFYDGIRYIDLDENRLQNLDNPIIVDIYYAEQHGIEIGDTVNIQPVDINYEPFNDLEPIEFIVSGTMDSSGFGSSRDSALIPMGIYEEQFAGLFYELALKLEEEFNPDEVKSRIADTYSNYSLEVITFDEMLGAQKGTIDTLIDGITIIIGLGMIVGILGISNNLMVSFNQRKKEYAVLYSVCMSKMQIVKMVFVETLITFIAVIIIGLLGGLALNLLLTKLLHAVGMVTEFRFTFELYGILCGVVAILLIVSTLSLVRKVFQLNIMKELRYE
ncbi:ABC transporter permease [Ornithinibacillus californiensis]|uniref:ABC transporter permease n=1 Tax=Ornithinibacillus californiensis TaxID=161536 RepID=UPI00064DEA9B|nr:FtsX-like permease family protein [Ornithinibacillus californiensis]